MGTVAKTQHPREPGGDLGSFVDQGRQLRRALEEPEVVGQGDVGHRGRAEEEFTLAALQLRLQPRQQGRQLLPGLLGRQPAQAATAEQRLAVIQKGLGLLRRQTGQARPHDLRLEHQRHGVLEQHRVRPAGKGGHDRLLAFRKQRRYRFFRLQAASDQRRVAIDVRTHLQHRRLAIATGERHQLGLGQHPRNDHRTPGETLEAQQQARLLGEGRLPVVMQNQLGHDSTPESAVGRGPDRASTRDSLARLGSFLIWISRRKAADLSAQAST